MLDFLHDLRFGFRQLRKSPGFALIAILTLALGIGANTAMFSVMSAVLMRYLPVREPQRIVFLHYSDQPKGTSQSGYDDTSLPEPLYEALRAEHGIFSDVVAFVPLSSSPLPVRSGETPEEARGDMVSGSFFSGLGVPIARGRGFSPDDEKSHAPFVVLSYAYWSRRFARDPNVIGQPLYVKGQPFTIVGVAGAGFPGLERDKATDFWIPLTDRAELKPWGHPATDARVSVYNAPHWYFLMMAGRLAPGITQEQALARLQPVYQRVAYEGLKAPEPGTQASTLYFSNARGIEGLRDAYREPLTLLMYMVVLVLAIACANVSMLLVARNTLRRREFSVRLALGSSRWRLFSQLMGEGLLLVLGGAALGWWFSSIATSALGSWSQIDVNLAPDQTVLWFTVAVSLVVALVFALAPLRGTTRVPIGLALKSSVSTTPEPSRVRAGHAVVVLQIAFCIVLLVGAALLVRTMHKLQTANLGMRLSGLVVFGVSTPPTVHSDAQAVVFYQSLLARLRALPGVEAGTVLANRLGAGWSNNTLVTVDGHSPLGDKVAGVRWDAVGPDVLRVLGTPVLYGRDISERDSANSTKVAIVNQTFVDRYLKNTAPLGHQLQLSGEEGSFTIIGVIPDIKYTGVRERPRPMAFVPYTQIAGISNLTVELRTTTDTGTVLAEARGTLRDVNPDLAPLQPMAQQQQFEQSFMDDRLFSRLAVFFGGLAALLVTTGLFGTLAYRWNRRIGEIGLRMALGAQRGQVLWMVLRESLLLCAFGVIVGLPLAIAAARLLRSMLFDLSPGDPWSFAAALLGIIAVALIASALPARRASTVDPMVALRYE